MIPREISIEYSASEFGLESLLRLDKCGGFIAKQGLIEWNERGFKNASTTLEIDRVKDTDARGSEAIYQDGKVVGRVTSGGYGWCTEKSLALALVDTGLHEIGTELELNTRGIIQSHGDRGVSLRYPK